MKKIAITGGIGSGKTTLLEHLKKCGYPVFSCDEIYKEVIKTPEYIQKIKVIFPDVVTQNGIDRNKLSELVFNNEDKRQLLNSVAHPLIIKNLFEKMEQIKKGFVFAEVPLLFEGNYEDLFDCVILVKRKVKNRIEALKIRDNSSDKNIEKRIAAQFDYDAPKNKKRLKNDRIYMVENYGSIEDMIKKVNELLKTM